jgi:putative transposase
MRRRRKIHSDLKILTALNALPAEFKKTVHRSQLKRYEAINPADYFGYDLSVVLGKELEWIRKFGDFPTAKKISVSILKLFVFFRSVVSGIKGFNKTLSKQKDFFVELAERFKEFIPIKSFARFIGLDESTLREWVRSVRVRCSDSLVNVCRKVHPNQLLLTEIGKMKKLLADENFSYWPLASVYYYALNNKIVSMALSTWYKYAALVNVERKKPVMVKYKTTGIRAARPNDLWHADVSYFFTPERTRLYIYIVMDNFSRFPLCVSVHDKLCGKFRAQTFRHALRRALEIDSSVENIKLMTDGGSENFNLNVSDFIRSVDDIPIRQIKALSDGWPSNSMAEAFFRTIKTYYLNNTDVRTLPGLKAALEFTANDFAFKRPYAQLKGLTPYQVYTGQKPGEISLAEQLKSAGKLRIILNQHHNCSWNCLGKG